MKTWMVLLTCILSHHLTFAQTEVYEKVVSEFESNYNANKFEAIFASFSGEMQEALPFEKMSEFLSALKSQAGNITSKEFTAFQNGTYASYQTHFEKETLSMNISINENNKIDGLIFNPLKEKKKNENVVNALSGMPGETAAIIFNQVKGFPDNTQLSIAVIENGKTTFYGVFKEKNTVKYIDNRNRIFEIGSISKVFTSTLLADAVLEKKVGLDDKINTFYPFPFKNDIQLDFKSLANHTSGLERLPANLDFSRTDPGNPYKTYDASQLNVYLKDELKLTHPAGEKYEYSNLGAGLLGYTLGLAQQSNYEKLLKDQIFKKYKMTSSFTGSYQAGKKLVKGLDSEGKEVKNWDFDVLTGAGGIMSTATDLSKFVTAQFDPANKDLALTRVPTFIIGNQVKIGLGWHIVKTESGKEVHWHNGGTGGYSSSMALDAANKNGIAILSNVSAFHPEMGNIDKLCFELLKQLEK